MRAFCPAGAPAQLAPLVGAPVFAGVSLSGWFQVVREGSAGADQVACAVSRPMLDGVAQAACAGAPMLSRLSSCGARSRNSGSAA